MCVYAHIMVRKTRNKDPIPWRIYLQKPGEKGRITAQKNITEMFGDTCKDLTVSPDWLLENFLHHVTECKKWRSETKKQFEAYNKPICQLAEAFKNTGEPRLAKIKVRK